MTKTVYACNPVSETLNPGFEPLTVETYDKFAKQYADPSFNCSSVLYREFGEFDYWLRGVDEAKILEVGCGNGDAVYELVDEWGFDYVGTDASIGMVKEARKRHPEYEFLHQSVYDLDFPSNHFDGFWASRILQHLPKARVGKALSRLHDVTKVGGIGFIAITKSKYDLGERLVPEKKLSAKDDPYGRWYSYYDKDEFSGVLASHGFKVLSAKKRKVGYYETLLVYFVEVIKPKGTKKHKVNV